MTSVDKMSKITMGGDDPGEFLDRMRIAPEKTKWIDIQIERVSEWFSSILVKESRQALKSRQFLWTFFLMLITVAMWALFALSYLYSDMAGRTVAPGPFLLSGFWMILGFPLAVIIPYSAHRSLAQEMEDGTLQLVSITTMRPYQIIAGKLGSACLQMITYLSVIAPCIVFTYLLRGVDLFQVFLGFSIAVTGCMFLSIVGLLLATVSRNRLIGMAVSILMILILLLALWLWCVYSYTSTFFGSSMRSVFHEPGAQLALWASFGTVFTTAAIFLAAACSQIAFEAENRATAIRIALLVQQTFAIGLSVTAITYQGLPESAYWVFAMWYSHYWLIIGSMLVSVPGKMSRRVRRRLPTKPLGKALFSLFMPGPGRGYLFAVANLIGCMFSFLCLMYFGDFLTMFIDTDANSLFASGFNTVNRPWRVAFSIYTATLYAVFFLTIVFLIMSLLKKGLPVSTPVVGALMAGILVAFFAMIGSILQYNLVPYSNNNYTILQSLNWYYTVEESFSSTSFSLTTMVVGCLTLLTGLLMVLAFRIIGRELRIGQLTVPDRVQQDIEERKKVAIPVGESIDEIFAAPRDKGDS